MHHSEVFVFCGAVSLGTLGIVLLFTQCGVAVGDIDNCPIVNSLFFSIQSSSVLYMYAIKDIGVSRDTYDTRQGGRAAAGSTRPHGKYPERRMLIYSMLPVSRPNIHLTAHIDVHSRVQSQGPPWNISADYLDFP